MSMVVHSLPRPNRLNLAGFCWMCGGRWCVDPQCVQQFEQTPWGICDECGGSQNLGHEWKLPCRYCNGGMVEYHTFEHARQSFELFGLAAGGQAQAVSR